MTTVRYADGARVPDSDLDAIARAFGFASAHAWIVFHAAAEQRRRRRDRRAA